MAKYQFRKYIVIEARDVVESKKRKIRRRQIDKIVYIFWLIE